MSKKSEKAETVIIRDARVQVTRTLEIGRDKEVIDEKDEEEVISVHEFVTEPAVVELHKGLTMAMGNYQFARFDVGVRLPCYAEEVPEALAIVDAFVQDRMAGEAEDIRQFFQNPSKHR